ncbi:MAG: hypothetical protein D6B25_12495 [Desulfobulbaceae bacterium]|nr:MAG: hypothetical protein D6B25_12495 [Desulfobulbaceae bacterium]
MSLQQSITAELKTAMKNRDTARTGAIRILIGEFQRQPEKELSDDAVINIIKKLIKSERELLSASGGEDSGYIEILEGYLPQQATEEDIRAWIVANINFADFGNKMQAMRPIMSHFGSSADGNTVKKVLQSL